MRAELGEQVCVDVHRIPVRYTTFMFFRRLSPLNEIVIVHCSIIFFKKSCVKIKPCTLK